MPQLLKGLSMPFFSRVRFFVYYYLLIREGNCYNEAPIGLEAIRANSSMIVGWEMHKIRIYALIRYRDLIAMTVP